MQPLRFSVEKNKSHKKTTQGEKNQAINAKKKLLYRKTRTKILPCLLGHHTVILSLKCTG